MHKPLMPVLAITGCDDHCPLTHQLKNTTA